MFASRASIKIRRIELYAAALTAVVPCVALASPIPISSDAYAHTDPATGKADWAATFSPGSSGLYIHVQIPGGAETFAWRLDTEQDFRATGQSMQLDPVAGKFGADTSFELPNSRAKKPVWFRYTTFSGEEKGPFNLVIDPVGVVAGSQKRAMTLLPEGWIQTQNFAGNGMVYFTTLVSSSCAVKEVHWGYDGSLDRTWPLPPCNVMQPGAIFGKVETAVKADPDASTVTVLVKFYDGTVSDVKTLRLR